ncbi:Zn(2)-C6 fungal-type domain-containing protein [Mycena chlorophos]|uniref:Oxidation resistance protein 1 n=1 Tax=Mycena chlorophos TaxID=658473 RepID=A0A8H6WL59_MYCCL|nr:Zn(2)-C6 fungal-type domain-containing protein [Mycena chlorophos]
MSKSPLDAFPALVPTPAPSPSPTPTRVRSDREEEAFDKFANLFLPPTPRASPVPSPPPLTLPVVPPSSASIASPDSEFGAFVSVSPTEDPLSASLAAFDPFTPVEAPASGLEEFSHSVQNRAETNRGLLDELLNHEDEPMYWLNESRHTTQPQPVSAPQPPISLNDEHDLLPSQRPNKWMTDSLSDLDFDFFTSPQTPHPPSPDPQQPHRRSSSHSSTLRSPVHSPSFTSARTLAPPLASNSTSEDAPGFEHRHATPSRSNSYAALASSLSKSAGGKWMASFLPSALASSAPNPGLLPPPVSSSSSSSPGSHSPSSSLANSLVLPQPPTSSSGKVPDLSHFTPFAPAHKPGSSSFSGAPGFRGDKAYDWDKGYSHALEQELGHTPEASEPEWDDDEDILILDGKGNATRVGGPSRNPSIGHSGNVTVKAQDGVGVLLERKMTLSINLEGRKAMTVGVLTNELVALIHPHLSALLRLPRKWTLLYSLDQHGISLKTLYSRCALQPASSRTPQPKGGLLVIQDTQGSIFGAWVPDGIKRSVGGAYYGGGESFLWRYVPSTGQFDVFKWTGKNDYVAFCEEGFISFGGGEGHYGLYIDDSLLDGSSARCPTFDNDPLCTSKGGKPAAKFECVGLEVWGIGP